MISEDTAAVRARSCAIAVMAKVPRPGRVKTRLCPPLTPEEATAMSRAFLRDITANLRLAGTPVQGFVAYAPAGLEPLFGDLLAPGTRLVLADGTDGAAEGVEGFGRCLLHAARALFAQGWGAVCLLNADSPTLPTAFLRQAAEALLAPADGPAEDDDGRQDALPGTAGNGSPTLAGPSVGHGAGQAARSRVVLGAAEDGGYYLIGLRAPHPELFARIRWSTGTVAAETRDRVREAELTLLELPSWYDVDDREALDRLVHEASGGAAPGAAEPFAAPATRSCMDGIGMQDKLATPH